MAPSQTDTESAARVYGGNKLDALGNTVSLTEKNELQVDTQHTLTITPITEQLEQVAAASDSEAGQATTKVSDQPDSGDDENNAGTTADTAE